MRCQHDIEPHTMCPTCNASAAERERGAAFVAAVDDYSALDYVKNGEMHPIFYFIEGWDAALAESAERVRELERGLNEYKIVNKYHAEKLGQLDALIEKAEAAITTFQWVTNSFKMSPEQQVRLGDAIVGLHDACEAAKDKAIRSGRGDE